MSNTFLLSYLPPLRSVEDKISTGIEQFLALARECGGAVEPVEALILENDLRTREAFLGGQIKEPIFRVLSEEEGCSEAVPHRLVSFVERYEGGDQDEALWKGYFSYLRELGRRSSVPFLCKWSLALWAMRESLAALRREEKLSEAVGRAESALRFVEPDLGASIRAAVEAWQEAEHPLSGYLSLERALWGWADRFGEPFTFSDGELCSYAAKLCVQERVQRVLSDVQGGLEDREAA